MNIEVSKDGRYLYTLNGNQGTVSVFQINDDGHLARLQVARRAIFTILDHKVLLCLIKNSYLARSYDEISRLVDLSFNLNPNKFNVFVH